MPATPSTSETRAELLQDIVTESTKLDQMLANMLSVAAIMAGRLTPLAEPVLVEPIARRTSAEVAAAAPNHRFVIQIPAGLPAAGRRCRAADPGHAESL